MLLRNSKYVLKSSTFCYSTAENIEIVCASIWGIRLLGVCWHQLKKS